ncbi:MAG: hypothetical protein ACFE9I_17150 [Candidatus Hermodarchaeota archaeon]
MNLEEKFKKLDEKLRIGEEFQSRPKVNIIHGKRMTPIEDDMKLKEELKEKKIQKLSFLTWLLKMIHEGATGFDLAYEVEKNQEIKHLIYDGILFYNAFLEIGTKKFIEMPDKKIENFKSFRTIEDTEKYIFLVWLNDTITSLKKELFPKEDYEEYVKSRRAKEIKEAKDQLRERLTHCKNCGTRIQSKEQIFCEECGKKLMEEI